MGRSSHFRILAVALAGIAFDAVIPPPSAAAEIPAIASRQRAEKKTFTDSEITEGFFKTAFGAEYHLAGRVDRIRKYDAPVRVFADGVRRNNRKAQLAKVVADIANRVRHLDIAMADSSDGANVVVKLVRDRDLFRTISTFYGSDRAREIRSTLDPQCLSGFRKNDKYEIEHSDVILTVDNGDFIFLDCAYEELLQALGPINDTNSIPWTMFNDSVQMGFFDVYDQYIMNILYDPRIKAGMTVAEVKAVLPEVLADVRVGCGRSTIWRSRKSCRSGESCEPGPMTRRAEVGPECARTCRFALKTSPCAVRAVRRRFENELCRFLEQLPPDQHAPDFAGAGADLVELGVAQQPPGRIVVDIAVAAEQLDGVERALRRLLGGIENGAGGVLARGLAAVAGFGHRVDVGARRIHRGVHVGDLALHQLKGADRLAELLALVHIGHHHVEAGLHDAERPAASTERS